MVPQERLWVGTIMDLILSGIDGCSSDELADVANWTIIVDEQLNEPCILFGRPENREALRHCSLGECESFPDFLTSLYGVGTPLHNSMYCEMIVQKMSFEICRRAEPHWDELVSPGCNCGPVTRAVTGVGMRRD